MAAQVNLIGVNAAAQPAYDAIREVLSANGYYIRNLWDPSSVKPQVWCAPPVGQAVFYISFRAEYTGLSPQENMPAVYHYLLCYRPYGVFNSVGEGSSYKGLDVSQLASLALAHLRRIEQFS